MKKSGSLSTIPKESKINEKVAQEQNLKSTMSNYFVDTKCLVSRGIGRFFLVNKDDEFYEYYYQLYHRREYRKKMNFLKFPGFQILSNISPIFH